MPAALQANVRRAAEQSTLTLPIRLPEKPYLTLAEVAAAIGVDESTAERLYDRKKLHGLKHSGGEKNTRFTKRVLRASAIAYIAANKNWDDDQDAFADSVIGCLQWFPTELLHRLISAAQRILAQRGA